MRNGLMHLDGNIKNKGFSLFELLSFIVIMLSGTLCVNGSQAYAQLERAGLRSSVYGFNAFPDTSWWLNVTYNMASKFQHASPSAIWIIGYTTTDNNGSYLNFPKPDNGKNYDLITFSKRDENEIYLSYFDRRNVKLWLEVEPGNANVDTLINLVLKQYSHHSCVIGFGVDCEWYRTGPTNNYEGESVSDSVAAEWCNKIKSFNKSYLFFLKHWLPNKMPATFRNDMVFIDDSQGFNNLNDMVSEFKVWAKQFAPSKVAFQFGYEPDKRWWSMLADPPGDIGNALLNVCTNISDLYWVDFTAYSIWPPDYSPTSISTSERTTKPEFELYQNYPEPFNPSTVISYNLTESGYVTLTVFSVLGREVVTLVNQVEGPGKYKKIFSASGLSSGVYFYRLSRNSFSKTKKMLLIR